MTPLQEAVEIVRELVEVGTTVEVSVTRGGTYTIKVSRAEPVKPAHEWKARR